MTHIAERKPKVVIIGAGFAGITAAQTLKNAPVDIEIIDKRNYHLFQPLLYQVATADLSPADIAWPIRGIFSSQKNVTVTLARVQDVDTENQQVICDEAVVDYDYLVIANGSSHSYFGKDHWEEDAPGLKKIIDATEIRRRVLLAFERAELARDEAEKQSQLTYVVVGAGPTGVELAGSIAELAKVSLCEDFRRVNPGQARVILMEGGSRVLSTFPDDLSQKAEDALIELGVEVRKDTMVENISEHGVVANGEVLPAATVIWAAGVKVHGLGDWLKVETDRVGRIAVNPDLSVPGFENIFVVGDAAKVPWKDGLDVPGIAPAAKQGGKYLGKLINARAQGRAFNEPFKYRHLGSLATVGRNMAVIDFGWMKLSGALAWWLWGIVHIYFLVGVRRPLAIVLSWFNSYVFRQKGARLITGRIRPRAGADPAAEQRLEAAE
ncbi:MAG: NAD(P)/FAD-dependent oxidoreductase [Pseudomonadota bacterium]